MKTLLTIPALVVACAATLFVVGCDHAASSAVSSPPIGKSCTIQFRRDALGSGASGPFSPLSGSVNGAEVALQGVLKSANGEWVVLETTGGEIWVPKVAILLIQFQ